MKKAIIIPDLSQIQSTGGITPFRGAEIGEEGDRKPEDIGRPGFHPHPSCMF